jgi:hypothetical protein
MTIKLTIQVLIFKRKKEKKKLDAKKIQYGMK